LKCLIPSSQKVINKFWLNNFDVKLEQLIDIQVECLNEVQPEVCWMNHFTKGWEWNLNSFSVNKNGVDHSRVNLSLVATAKRFPKQEATFPYHKKF
jgi:hypothetical protein